MDLSTIGEFEMSFYTRLSFRLFGEFSERLLPYFVGLKEDTRRARIKMSFQEYMSITLFTGFMTFLLSFPISSFLFALYFKTFLFAFITSFVLSLGVTVLVFFLIIYYPQLIIKQKAKDLNNSLPFATLYLSTIASTKLPLHKTFQIFSKFSEYGEITNEVNFITNDVEAFGLDINTALERAIDRSTSKNFKEVIWGLLSTIQAGGDVNIYLKEKAKSFMEAYRRSLYEFSQQLTLYIEVYLTAIILGAIFFTILTAIMSGMGGEFGGGLGGMDIITLQFFLIFVFSPLVSIVFIILIKTISPSSE